MIVECYCYKFFYEVVIDFICDNFLLIWEMEEYLKMDFVEVKELFLSDERFVIKI